MQTPVNRLKSSLGLEKEVVDMLQKKRFKISYVVTLTYPELELEDFATDIAIMEYMKRLNDGNLGGTVQKNARWNVSSVNGDRQ